MIRTMRSSSAAAAADACATALLLLAQAVLSANGVGSCSAWRADGAALRFGAAWWILASGACRLASSLLVGQRSAGGGGAGGAYAALTAGALPETQLSTQHHTAGGGAARRSRVSGASLLSGPSLSRAKLKAALGGTLAVASLVVLCSALASGAACECGGGDDDDAAADGSSAHPHSRDGAGCFAPREAPLSFVALLLGSAGGVTQALSGGSAASRGGYILVVKGANPYTTRPLATGALAAERLCERGARQASDDAPRR